MNKIFISNITLSDPRSKHNGKTTNVIIDAGVLHLDVADSAGCDIVVDGTDTYLSPGWIDCMAYCGEPGEEWKEDLASLAEAASAGGFTSVAAFCGNHPYPDKAAAIQSILKKSVGLPAEIWPVGAATKSCAGLEMSEIYDLYAAGAVAVSNGEINVGDAGLVSRIMEYANHVGIPFIDIPFNKNLSMNGVVHDGAVANSLGLKGIPAVSEFNALRTSAEIAEWLKLPIRLAGISSEASVQSVRELKAKGLNVHVGVAVMNLVFSDEDLASFHEDFKVLPPLRSDVDRKALIEGILDGTIDFVYSNHMPQDTESKNVEFEYAAFGASTIQTAFGMLLKSLGDKASPDRVVTLLSLNPAVYLKREIGELAHDYKGNYTIFKTSGDWTLSAKNMAGKSKNNPMLANSLPGAVLGTVVAGKWFPNKYI